MKESFQSSRLIALGFIACFCGWTGLHNWYLGQKKRAFGHLILTIISFTFIILAVWLNSLPLPSFERPGLSASSALASQAIYTFSTLMGSMLTMALGYIIGLGNAVWGFIEGISLFPHPISLPRVVRHVDCGTVYLSPRSMPPTCHPTQMPPTCRPTQTSPASASAPYHMSSRPPKA